MTQVTLRKSNAPQMFNKQFISTPSIMLSFIGSLPSRNTKKYENFYTYFKLKSKKILRHSYTLVLLVFFRLFVLSSKANKKLSWWFQRQEHFISSNDNFEYLVEILNKLSGYTTLKLPAFPASPSFSSNVGVCTWHSFNSSSIDNRVLPTKKVCKWTFSKALEHF